MGAKTRRFAPIPRGGGRQSDGSRSVGGCPLPGYFSFAAAALSTSTITSCMRHGVTAVSA